MDKLSRGNNEVRFLFDQDAGVEARIDALENMVAAIKEGFEDLADLLLSTGIVGTECKTKT